MKISELEKIQERVGGTAHELALELWTWDDYDATHLAGLLADDAHVTKAISRAGCARPTAAGSPNSPCPGSPPAVPTATLWPGSGSTRSLGKKRKGAKC